MNATTTRKFLVATAAGLLLVWGLGASKETTKIGFYDLELAVTTTTEGKAALDELERKKREAEQSLMPLQQRMQDLRKEFEAKQFVLSDEARYQKQLDLQELNIELENKAKSAQSQFQLAQERLINPLRQKLDNIVEAIGREQGYSFIMARGAPGLTYTREALDITELIIAKFNEKG